MTFSTAPESINYHRVGLGGFLISTLLLCISCLNVPCICLVKWDIFKLSTLELYPYGIDVHMCVWTHTCAKNKAFSI